MPPFDAQLAVPLRCETALLNVLRCEQGEESVSVKWHFSSISSDRAGLEGGEGRVYIPTSSLPSFLSTNAQHDWEKILC
jgi:hypothetical protein